MSFGLKTAALFLSAWGAVTLGAQDLSNYTSFTLDGKTIQIHGFVSEGFAYSDDNNYLTMNTSQGSFFTDGGVNLSAQLTDKFRVGAQVYDRNIGSLGQWHPSLDWAVADYKFKDWFGIRGGKVKTVIGLFNDTQDMEFLHTWAILPQSLYPLDLRSNMIAHNGGDAYGTIALRKAGDVSYTVYGGTVSYDKYGGYPYGLVAEGLILKSLPSHQIGGDLRWNGLVKGLLLGASYLHMPQVANATKQVAPGLVFPVTVTAHDNAAVFYTEYKAGNLTIDGEYRRDLLIGTTAVGPLPRTGLDEDERGWYISAAYRISKRFELGAYESQYFPLWVQNHAPPSNHMYDTVAALRIDLVGQWDLKIEEHFMNGYGTPYSFRGFYPQDNPDGLKPKTDMLVVRTGWNF
jgi:hypothetical protein